MRTFKGHSPNSQFTGFLTLQGGKAGMEIPFNKHALSAYCLPDPDPFSASPGNSMWSSPFEDSLKRATCLLEGPLPTYPLTLPPL